MRRLTGSALVGTAVLAVVGITGYAVLHHVGPLLEPEECHATVAGHTVTLSTEQAENAALIAAVSVQRGMPARAASIALATAYQESKLYNVEQGDRDSLGLFQQRPSQGWGTRQEILNPYYATNAFYDALDKVDGYDTMRITEAAQEVQRSGYPEAYAEHEADARALASALTGQSPHAFTCVVRSTPSPERNRLDEAGLTHRASLVRREVKAVFGEPVTGGSAHDGGRAIDVLVRPVSPASQVTGWAIAQYLVAQADRLDVRTVIFDAHIWKSGGDSDDGWRSYDPPEPSGDHVHVDVFG